MGTGAHSGACREWSDRGIPDRGIPDRGIPDRGIPDRGTTLPFRRSLLSFSWSSSACAAGDAVGCPKERMVLPLGKA